MIGPNPTAAAGTWKINSILAHALVIVGLLFCGYLFIPFGTGSWGGVVWFFSEPFLMFLVGVLVMHIIPRTLYNSYLLLFLLFMLGYCLFWIYVFTVMRYIGFSIGA